MRSKGRITVWHDDRGYGFIKPVAGGKQVFVHVKAFGFGSRRPELNRLVSYDLSTDSQGRPCATKVHMAADREPQAPPRPSAGWSSILLAISFFGLLGFWTFKDSRLIVAALIYGGASAFTFILYGSDKSAAKQGAQRTPESLLHWGALLGGWPGALIAQSVFRHKTRKQPFRFIFWMTIVLNLIGLGVWVATS